MESSREGQRKIAPLATSAQLSPPSPPRSPLKNTPSDRSNTKGFDENTKEFRARSVKTSKHHSWWERIGNKTSRLVWELLVTVDTLEDITTLDAPKYFTPFIAPDVSSGKCETIPKVWSMKTAADLSGKWKGESGFKVNQAAYFFDFSGLMVDQSGYNAMMTKIDSGLQLLGKRAQMNDLALNMIIWSSWRVTAPIANFDGTFRKQSMSLAGSPQMIMYNNHIQGTIANVSHDCRYASSTTSYSKSESKLYTLFNVDDMMADPTCNGMLNLRSLGYDPLVTPGSFQISIDVQTLFTALAVSLGINGAQAFEQVDIIQSVVENVDFGGVNFTVYQMYDPLYPGMDPIWCLGPSDTYPKNWNCVVKIGQSYGFPIIVHRGANFTFPERCNCMTNGKNKVCDDFDFIVGAAVFDVTKNDTVTYGKKVSSFPELFQPFLPIVELLYVEPVISVASGNQKVFPSAFAAMKQGKSPKFRDKAWRKNSYRWCLTNSFGHCSLVLWESYDDFLHVVSADQLEVKDGACADSISSPGFVRLVNQPWAPLENEYVKCFMKSGDAFINAFGIATGNAAIAYSLIIIFTVFLSFLISNWLYPDFKGNDDASEKDVDASEGSFCAVNLSLEEENSRIIEVSADLPAPACSPCTSDIDDSPRLDQTSTIYWDESCEDCQALAPLPTPTAIPAVTPLTIVDDITRFFVSSLLIPMTEAPTRSGEDNQSSEVSGLNDENATQRLCDKVEGRD